MSCSVPPRPASTGAAPSAVREEIRIASRALGVGLRQTSLSVAGLRCAGCIRTVESGLSRLSGVEHVRVNLSTKRVNVTWRGDEPPDLLDALAKLGFPGHLAGTDDSRKDPELGRLIRALAVAGFSAMNIMLLSVSVWSGADPATRHAFHWISALLALPCLLYSGRIFFVSAWSALRRGRTNMDVPISIGVCLTFGLSLYDTIANGPYAYFDAASSLIFFLLIGRTLDYLMREKTRVAVRGLARLSPRGAMVLRGEAREYLTLEEIEPGMRILVAAGDRIPVDGRIVEGTSDLDCALATGESAPRRAAPGLSVQAGMLNLTGPLIVLASARAENSFLAEMIRLMEAAESGRARYRRLADRAAALYSPVVHSVAFLTFLGWLTATGDWHGAITTSIAVLIITCPCALGLAVPIVQVVAARRLYENGIMVKDGSAIERLAEIDMAVFDKTGTLTIGRPRLVDRDRIAPGDLAIAARIAGHSRHPVSQSIAAAALPAALPLADAVEYPGLGIEARIGDKLYRLGRAEWALGAAAPAPTSGTMLSCNGELLARFAFEDTPRPQAREALESLSGASVDIAMLSGDTSGAVSAMAARLGIGDFAAELLPAEKVRRLEEMAGRGRKVLMVGDGLNDAPALAAAYVSMAPATAADIGRYAADFVFLRDGLDAVPKALAITRDARRLVQQNFAVAAIYNAVALPIAVAGYVTPLVAALAMSLSSVLVVVNALRLGSGKLPSRAGAASKFPSTRPEPTWGRAE